MLTKDPHMRITLDEIKKHLWVAGHILGAKRAELAQKMQKQKVM